MTTINDAFPSKYLKAKDLDNRTIKLKIARVTFEEVGQGKDQKPVMYFDGTEKGMVLNKTNAKRIGKMHGEQMDNWSGKEIELYSELVPFQGEDVPSIRVHIEAPERPQREDFNAPLGGGDPNDPLGI